MDKFFHSVTLEADRCLGCTNCIKRCPTEAIRVRDGKASIISERCIDCGECIRICPHHAKKPVYDHFSMLKDYKYNVALPAPSLYGQFNNLDDIDIVLSGLKLMGFDDVFEVSAAAELVSDATRIYMAQKNIKKPVISSACPAVVRLIRVRFPDLCENVLPLKAPMEVAADIARKRAHEKHPELKDEEIGIFFISPCAAKVTDIKAPIGTEKSSVSGVLAISSIFAELASQMGKVETVEPLSESGIIGISWGGIGGESSALLREQYLAADGIENVIKVLEELEDEKFTDLDFIELNACAGGCLGGVLTVENPYVARARLKRLRKYLPVSCSHVEDDEIPDGMRWTEELEFAPVMELSSDIGTAMEMMNRIDEISAELPGLDCGSCGAPSCRCLAEDVVRGEAHLTDCVFILRKRVQTAASALSSIGINHLGKEGEDQ